MSRRLIGFICLILLTTTSSVSSKSTPETLQAVSDEKGINNEDEYGGEYDYGYDDEYEDELRAIATSAETSKAATNSLSKSSAIDVQHAYEKQSSMETSNPPNSTNNKLIHSNAKDEKVTELKSYMNRRSKALKTKRIPTVKKELSTQKEILSVNNETQVPKSLLSSENISNRLGEDARDSQDANAFNKNVLDQMKQSPDELHAGRLTLRSDATAFSSNFMDIDEQSDITKKFNKRRNAVLKDLQDYLLEEYTEKREEQILKNIEEAAVTKNLLKLLTELAEDPERWLRVNRFLAALDDDLSPAYSETQKRNDLSQNFDLAEALEEAITKAPKRPRWKHRRRRLRKHKQSTTSTTTSTTMTPFVVAETDKDTDSDSSEPIEPDWLSRLKIWQNNYPKSTAEQVFEGRWPSQMKDNENTYLKSNNRDSTQQKEHRNSQRLASESERIIVSPPALQPRLLHYGKVYDRQSENTDEPIVYDRGAAMMNNYGALQKPYDIRYRNAGRGYDDYERLVANVDYPLQSKYDWPWNFPSNRAPFNKWSWQPPHRDHTKTWNYWNKSWQNNRDYWSELNDRANDNTNTYPETKRIKPKEQTWDHERTVPKINTNRPELKSNKEQIDNNELPKISMKTWTSLTSDPATWPFKLPGVKPWPKDENGHTYNPNADLVRKLGLDQEEEAKIDENKKNQSDAVKMSQSTSEGLRVDEDTRSWSGIMNSERKSWSQKNSWKPVNSFEEDLTSQRDRSSMTWPARVSNSDDIWSSKSDRDNPWSSSKLHDEWNFGKPSQTSSTWPNKWKQFAYHRVTAFPMSKSGPTLEGSAKPKNAYIAVSAVSAPKYAGNEWKKNEIEDLSMTQMKPVDHEQPIYAWKKNGLTNNTKARQDKEPGDPLEHQLKDLRLHELDNSSNVVRNTTTASVSQASTSASNEPGALRENKSSSKLSTHLEVQRSNERESEKKGHSVDEIRADK